MDIKPINEQVAVSGQVMATDMAAVAKAGFRSVICNRPDGEAPDQPDFAEVEKAALAQGLTVRYLPVISGAMTGADVAAFGEAMEELPKPVFAYCRTGTRCAALWALDQKARGEASDEIIKATRNAGYDLAGLIRS